MMAAGCVAFDNPTDAAQAYPKLWPSRKAANSAMARHKGRLAPNSNKTSPIREWCQPLAEVTFQRTGAGRSPSTATVDMTMVPNTEAWLTERLGPLSRFEITPTQQTNPASETDASDLPPH
jgi:putative DNA primase/helicase